MPVSVPTIEEFNALIQRVSVLEQFHLISLAAALELESSESDLLTEGQGQVLVE